MVSQPSTPPEEVYQSEAQWPNDINHVLAVHCSDPWHRQATTEFLERQLGLEWYDLMAVPGGPAVILQHSLTFTSDRSRIKLLLERHECARIVAITHSGCLYYKLRYPSLDDEERRKRQEADLIEFERTIRKLVPIKEVNLFIAEHINDRFRFMRVR